MPTEGRILYHFHTGTMTRKSPTLVAQAPEGYVEVNPDDARELGLSDGGNVRINSRRGEILIKANVTDKVKTAVVSHRFTSSKQPPISLRLQRW